ILAALLLPALGKARARAKRLQCLNNQRQLTWAWMFYAHENSDKVLYADILPRNTNAPVWVQGQLDFVPSNLSNWSVNQDIKISPLWNYCLSAEIWRCPADRSVVKVSGQLLPRVRTMAMNGYVGGFGGGPRTDVTVGGRIFHRLTDMTDPGP